MLKQMDVVDVANLRNGDRLYFRSVVGSGQGHCRVVDQSEVLQVVKAAFPDFMDDTMKWVQFGDGLYYPACAWEMFYPYGDELSLMEVEALKPGELVWYFAEFDHRVSKPIQSVVIDPSDLPGTVFLPLSLAEAGKMVHACVKFGDEVSPKYAVALSTMLYRQVDET